MTRVRDQTATYRGWVAWRNETGAAGRQRRVLAGVVDALAGRVRAECVCKAWRGWLDHASGWRRVQRVVGRMSVWMTSECVRRAWGAWSERTVGRRLLAAAGQRVLCRWRDKVLCVCGRARAREGACVRVFMRAGACWAEQRERGRDLLLDVITPVRNIIIAWDG